MAVKNPYKFEREVLEFGENVNITPKPNGTNTVTVPAEAVKKYNLLNKKIKSIKVEFEP